MQSRAIVANNQLVNAGTLLVLPMTMKKRAQQLTNLQSMNAVCVRTGKLFPKPPYGHWLEFLLATIPIESEL